MKAKNSFREFFCPELTYYILNIRACLFGLFLMSGISSFAQRTTFHLSGTIISASDKKPLPGATVKIEGQKNTAYADADGRFTITATSPSGILLINFVGFRTEKVSFSASHSGPFAISLTENENILQEVQVISTGYQKISPERMTGSVATIDNRLFEQRISSNFLDRLDGIATGLFFNGQANSGSISKLGINIRGQSTIDRLKVNTDPLIVLDNFPYSGDLSNINPNDIESINVLKDAAAASIWGARAGNGVIVITTKKGRSGQPLKLDFSSNFTFGQKPDLYYDQHFIPAPDFIEMEKYLYGLNAYKSTLSNSKMPAVSAVVEILADNTLSQEEKDRRLAELGSYDSRQDYDRYIYRDPVSRQYSLAMRGGSETVVYSLSMGYDDNDFNRVRTGNNRFTLNSLTAYKPLKNLELTAGLIYTKQRIEDNNPFAFSTSNGMYPYSRLADDEGNPVPLLRYYRTSYIESTAGQGFLDWYYRPLQEVNLSDNTTGLNDLVLKGGARYSFKPWLSAEVQGQHEQQATQGRIFRSEDTYYTRDLINEFSVRNASTGVFTYPVPRGGILSLSQADFVSDNLRGQLNVTPRLGSRHELSAMAGAEIRQDRSKAYSRTSYGYDPTTGVAVTTINYDTSLPVNPSGTLKIPSAEGSFTQATDRFISYYANASYTLDGKYTAYLSGRKDGANIFGVKTNDRVTPLWSAGLSWNLARESFYHVEWLPSLRLLASYGYNGNVYNGSAYLTAAYLKSSLTGLQYGQVRSAPNAELRWEKVRNINIGLDFALKDNRLSGTIEWFRKDATDLIEDAPLAPSTGFTSFKGNAAATKGNGLDLTLNSRNIDGRRFKWYSTVLLSAQHDKVKSYDIAYTTNKSIAGTNSGAIMIGQPVYSLYSYRWVSLDGTNGDPQGYLNGSVSKDYTSLLKSGDIAYSGSLRPSWYGSLRNTFSYGSLSLTVSVMGKFGHVFRRSTVSANYSTVASLTGMHEDYLLRWQQPGDELHTNVPSLVYPSNSNRDSFYQYSEVLVEKGDNVRLQYVNLNYDLTRRQWKHLPLERVSLYVYANNLGILWRANHKGIDPDISPVSGFPAARTIAAGMKVNF